MLYEIQNEINSIFSVSLSEEKTWDVTSLHRTWHAAPPVPIARQKGEVGKGRLLMVVDHLLMWEQLTDTHTDWHNNV
jgi:hypothetical protein